LVVEAAAAALVVGLLSLTFFLLLRAQCTTHHALPFATRPAGQPERQ
jgi:hypothetical protein